MARGTRVRKTEPLLLSLCLQHSQRCAVAPPTDEASRPVARDHCPCGFGFVVKPPRSAPSRAIHGGESGRSVGSSLALAAHRSLSAEASVGRPRRPSPARSGMPRHAGPLPRLRRTAARPGRRRAPRGCSRSTTSPARPRRRPGTRRRRRVAGRGVRMVLYAHPQGRRGSRAASRSDEPLVARCYVMDMEEPFDRPAPDDVCRRRVPGADRIREGPRPPDLPYARDARRRGAQRAQDHLGRPRPAPTVDHAVHPEGPPRLREGEPFHPRIGGARDRR
jgi:hypothetical protein